MAKKRKPAAGKSATSRRVALQSNANATDEVASTEVPGPSESSAPPTDDNAVSNDAASTNNPTDAKTDLPLPKQCVPVVALHKKFGKYLISDAQFSKKYDVGSDSETSNSVDSRVELCAGSESDSNAAIDVPSDTASGVSSISPMNSTNKLELDISVNSPPENEKNTVKSLLEEPVQPIPTDSSQSISTEPPSLDCVQRNDISINESTEVTNIPLLLEGNDDEFITIVQIIEDDNQSAYYDINIDSPKQSLNMDTVEQLQEPVGDFQEHFQKLNLSTSVNTNIEAPMACLEILDSTNDSGAVEDTPMPKEPPLDTLLPRPDPSLTPSSTLSDDSNSSRIQSEQNQLNSNDSAESSPTGVRRSSRIKTISTLKQKTKGYGLVKTPLKKALITQTKLKLEELNSDSSDRALSDTNLPISVPNSPSFPVPLEMPVKVKSRWRRSSELEMGCTSPAVSPLASPSLPRMLPLTEEQLNEEVKENVTTKEDCQRIINERIKQFQHLDENDYLCDRMISKDAKKMICDCFLTKEEIERGELGCGEDCLNRLLMIECNYRCPVGERCTNRRFQNRENTPLTVFYADKKGCGVEASGDIPTGEFLMEYVGEVLDYEQFYKRAQEYSDDNNLHHYFMSLKGETVIDATMKGNISRFINHSCDPNAETQKWTVNGELRIGFFSKRDIAAGEEITFDYQFQRFGKVAQRCYCGTENCRGWIGAEPDSDEYDEEDEDDVSTSKSVSTEASEETLGDGTGAGTKLRVKKRRPKGERRKLVPPTLDPKYEDADIEEDLEALSRTGVKNQSHTLQLSRTMVRAKGRRAQIALLRLLRDADLPCRRLFLDYRGLRLVSPWCADAPLSFRLEVLQTVDRLPIPNKTIVQESRFISTVERWLSSASENQETVFIDENTGLPVDIPNLNGPDMENKQKETAAVVQKVKELSKQLLERWSSLKEVFKIPKKERLQQMKEHERQANVERRAADSSGSRDRDRDRRDEREREHRDRERERDRERDRDRERERDRDRYRERDRDRDKQKDRERDDRDRRKRRSSPEGRRSIRLSDRVLASIPPVSKEDRRRAFAEAAAAAEEERRKTEQQPAQWSGYQQWQADGYPQQMFPPGIMPGPSGIPGMLPGPPILPGMPPSMLNMMPGPDCPPEWIGPSGEYTGPPPGFCPPFGSTQQFCLPQPNYMGMGGFPMGFPMFPPTINAQQPFPPALDVENIVKESTTVTVQVQANGEVLLPSMWRSAKDERGRLYYYHVKLRQPQWIPPPYVHVEDSSSEEEEDVKTASKPVMRRQMVEGVSGIFEVIKENKNGLIPDHALVDTRPRKRRAGLVTERPISPRTEEDKLAGKLEVKRYKETKEKLRKKKEKFLQKVKMLQRHAAKHANLKGITAQEIKMIELDSEIDTDSSDDDIEVLQAEDQPPPVDAETARKIKDTFRSSMARVMVQQLNPYRHSSVTVGRITSTADFKHLARKLTHFVMLKELKQCSSVQELVCTDSVRNKAKEFVRKYMAKFGPVYNRPAEDSDHRHEMRNFRFSLLDK